MPLRSQRWTAHSPDQASELFCWVWGWCDAAREPVCTPTKHLGICLNKSQFPFATLNFCHDHFSSSRQKNKNQSYSSRSDSDLSFCCARWFSPSRRTRAIWANFFDALMWPGPKNSTEEGCGGLSTWFGKRGLLWSRFEKKSPVHPYHGVI